MQTARRAFEEIWHAAEGDPEAAGRLDLAGDGPALPSVFDVTSAALASVGASALAAAELWRLRTGRAQRARVDARRATTAYRSEHYLLQDGRPARSIFDPVHGFYQCGDGRWIQLHTNYPQHRMGVFELFGCPASRAGIEAALARRSGQEAEDEVAAAGLPVGLMRSPEEWVAHPQGRAVAALPLFEIVRIGDAPPEPLPPGPERPLSGVRVLDLTKVIAGPLAGRTLAEHGAEVLTLAGRHMSVLHSLLMDQNRGKRVAWLDLRREDARARLRELVQGADVFVQGYRPGSIAARGFAPEDLAAMRPGIVAVSLCAFSHEGLWAMRRGFDSIVQQVSGIAWEGARAFGQDRPKHLPCQALDHSTGYLAAFGAMMALARRQQEGGSWLVRVSLAQTGHWLKGLGRVEGGMDVPDPTVEDVADLMETLEGPYGRISAPMPAAELAETPGHWNLPAAPYGSHEAAWAA